ncbi:exportin-4 isoform X1 [Triticum aestivum]|uniref:exportin-4 isoform X1 n=2 Tax=Triticum aestivum TaxID=4565 RepID=UPI001D00A98D|nr:exportin-4-like isoform X1 [Triticum aestivum]
MQGFPGGVPDPQQLQATMLAIEQACSLIQVHMNPAEAEKVLSSLHSSLMPYQACRFILETSLMPNARFQAAGAIGDAAIREWGILTDDNKRSLILYCLNYVMEHAGSPDGYVQSKVSAVAARLLKRGWLEFPDQEKGAIFFEVEQSIRGMHGPNRQFAGINFLETLVSEFSPSTASSMGLPKEFHDQCQLSLEVKFLKDFYCWAQAAVFNTADKILNSNVTIPEEKACSAALRLMLQILSWSFKPTLEHENLDAKIKSGLRSDAINLRKFERSLVKPGSLWTDILISSAHTIWVLNFYTTLRQKYSYDTLWGDSPIAVSCRQLIVQLCSLAGAVFPNDNGDAQIEHFMHILSAVILWIEPPNVIAESIRNGGSESEFIDSCHVLLSVASLTSSSLFDNLLKSIRQYGTINLLSALTSEAVKSVLDNQNEEETWGSDALDILLETWNVILGEACADKSPMSADGALAASNLFKIIVESHLKAAADSAFEDSDDAEYFHVSVSKRDEQLALYALIARAAADTTIPFLEQLFSERFARLSQQRDVENDPTRTLEELYWLLLITSHVLTDSGEGETLLIPEALQVGFTNVVEVAQHPVVTLSWSIINFSRQCLDPGIRGRYFSPRLMEAVIWFLARWVATYLVPLDVSREIDSVGRHGSQHSRKLLNSFAWDNNQGELVLDFVALMSMVALTTYQGEIELQTLTCQKLLASVVRRKHTCAYVVQLDSWRDLTRAFASGRSLFSLSGRLQVSVICTHHAVLTYAFICEDLMLLLLLTTPSQRSLAETLACAASCIKDPEASVQYLRDLMGPVAGCLVENASRSDLKSVAHQPDVIYMVCCLLERLRGAARATQPRTQKVLFEMGHTVMNSLLTLLEVYKNQSEVVYMILKFVVDFIDGQAVFLDGKETSVLMSFCLHLLQIYSSHNIGKVMLSLSSTLRSESQSEKYKDLRALLRLLTNICSKDLVGFLSDSNIEGSPDIAEVIYVGLDIVTPLISLDLLKYPKLSRDYFVLMSHLLEVYPEKVAHLNRDAFGRITGSLEFGLRNQDGDVVERCLTAVNALASYHFKERFGGRGGLGSQVMESEGSNGKLQESISSHFLRLLLQLLLFEDFRMELAGSAADALLPLLFCEQELYQRLVHELLEKQQNPTIKSRLALAFHNLTSSNNLSSTLDRPNRQKFRKNLRVFLGEVSGFMQIK